MDQKLRLDSQKKQRKKFFVLLTILLVGGILYTFLVRQATSELWTGSNKKTITVVDGNLFFSFTDVEEKTIGEFLTAEKLDLQPGDSIFPEEETALFSGTRIYIGRAHPLTVKVDGSEQTLRTQALSVGEALLAGGIVLNEDDIVKPERETFASSGLQVTVTRVTIREESVDRPIAFEKRVNEDNKLSWRKSIVTQKGEPGIERLTYRVSSHDGQEVNRKLLRAETLKESVAEIITQGTYVQVGKSHKGAASWYAWTGTMAAANPWLPLGSYVRVTNTENGKSVIVKINDRGPFAPGRIIDLDKVAFQKLASLGQGVINVKMEEITN